MVRRDASATVVAMGTHPVAPRVLPGAVLGGVCAGLARRWQVDPTVLRIAMVLLALLGGLGIAFYVGALLLVPKDGSSEFRSTGGTVHPVVVPAAAIGAVVGLGVVITVAVGSWLPFGLAPWSASASCGTSASIGERRASPGRRSARQRRADRSERTRRRVRHRCAAVRVNALGTAADRLRTSRRSLA